MTYIYGFKDNAGCFVYVGIAVWVFRREQQHRRTKPELANCRCVVIRSVTESDSLRIESQIVKALKRRGQCALNKQLKSGRAPRYGCPIEYQGRVFPSELALAVHIGCSPQYAKQIALGERAYECTYNNYEPKDYPRR